MARTNKPLSVIILAAIIACSCAPIPHNVYRAPIISGSINNGKAPLSNTNVYLTICAHKQCDKATTLSKTNDQGLFEIGPIKDIEYFVLFIGDPVTFWNLFIETNGVHRSIMSQTGIGSSPHSLRVKCDISKNEDTFIEAFGEIRGKCTSIMP